MTAPYRMTLDLLTPAQAEPAARPVLEKARQGLGFVPNMYAAMANLPALLQAYTSSYALFRAEGGFTAVEQEVVFLAISRENACHYCVAAHSVVADKMSKVPPEATEAVRDGAPVPDARLDALRNFTRAMVETKGRPSEADARAFLAAGYTETHILAVILAIGVKTFSNYANHVFHTPVDEMFQSRAWKG